LRVALATTYPPQRCGIGTYSQQLACALAGVPDTDVTVFAERDGELDHVSTDGPVTVRRCWDRRQDWVAQLLASLSANPPDVLHLQHSPDIWGTDSRILSLLSELELRRLPTVVTLHTVHDNLSALLERRWGFRRFIARLGQTAGAIVVHQSRGMVPLLHRDVAAERVHVIAHGTLSPRLPDAAACRQRLGLPKDGPMLLCFGFIHLQKNLHTVVEAMSTVRRDHPSAHLVIAGSIQNRNRSNLAYLRHLQRRGEHVGGVQVIERFISDEDVVGLYSAATLALFPYWQLYGSASGVLHLAIATHTPVLCSRSPKFSEAAELLGEEVILPTFGARRWGQAASDLLAAPERLQAMSERLRQHAEQTAWPRIAARTVALYEQLALSRRATS
jgi:glycosyltransferase involved in cell wall biosynthesis